MGREKDFYQGDFAENLEIVLIQIGAVKRCLIHQDELIDSFMSDVVEEAMAEYKEIFGDLPYDKDDFEEAVQNILSRASERCPLCG